MGCQLADPQPEWKATREIIAATTIYHMASMISDAKTVGQIRTGAAGVIAKSAQQLERHAAMQK